MKSGTKTTLLKRRKSLRGKNGGSNRGRRAKYAPERVKAVVGGQSGSQQGQRSAISGKPRHQAPSHVQGQVHNLVLTSPSVRFRLAAAAAIALAAALYLADLTGMGLVSA